MPAAPLRRPAAGLSPLLARRLVVVTGKGGTGKTSVVAALGRAAANAGHRVLLVETGRDENLPRLLSRDGRPAGYAGRSYDDGLRSMRIDPYDALAEYLRLQLGVPGLVTRVLHNRGFRQLMDAAPGWRELITLGKVWHLEQQKDPRGEPLHDLLIVDAPATGHGLTFLDVPRVVVSAVRAGPLKRHASAVEAMLEDEAATLLVPVALPEELPARETAELVHRVREGVGIRVDRVVVNAVPAPPFPAALPDLDARLATLPADARIPGLPDPRVLARCAAHLRGRYELAQEYVARIGEWTGLPLVALPWLAQGVRGPAELDRLAEALLAGEAS
ncbi:MAG TPA: ArsA-related P-loop ATPase [Myxococcota bacterium]|nr:ArsA-related P-loop ATPase [Myxococcota bacterium]